MAIEGSCHCGAIKYSVQGEPNKALECNCSHCQRKGFLLWFVDPESFTVTGDEAAMTSYRFNKHSITHKFCATCGVQPFARGQTREGVSVVAVNLRAAPDFDRSTLTIVQVDGKSF